MKCVACGSEKPSQVLYQILFPLKSESSYVLPLGHICEECAKKHNVFCEKHKMIFRAYSDKTMACVKCIEDVVAGISDADVKKVFDLVESSVSEEDRELLMEMLGLKSEMEEIGSKERALMRYVVERALRKGVKWPIIVEDVVCTGKVEPIFGPYPEANIDPTNL